MIACAKHMHANHLGFGDVQQFTDFTIAVLTMNGGFSFALVAAYLLPGLGPTGQNLTRLAELGSVLRALRVPWLIAADWNMEAGLLQRSQWLAEMAGTCGGEPKVLLPQGAQITCKCGGGTLIDYMVASPVMAEYIHRVGLDDHAPWTPHAGLRLELHCKPQQVQMWTLAMPSRFRTIMHQDERGKWYREQATEQQWMQAAGAGNTIAGTIRPPWLEASRACTSDRQLDDGLGQWSARAEHCLGTAFPDHFKPSGRASWPRRVMFRPGYPDKHDREKAHPWKNKVVVWWAAASARLHEYRLLLATNKGHQQQKYLREVLSGMARTQLDLEDMGVEVQTKHMELQTHLATAHNHQPPPSSGFDATLMDLRLMQELATQGFDLARKRELQQSREAFDEWIIKSHNEGAGALHRWIGEKPKACQANRLKEGGINSSLVPPPLRRTELNGGAIVGTKPAIATTTSVRSWHSSVRRRRRLPLRPR